MTKHGPITAAPAFVSVDEVTAHDIERIIDAAFISAGVRTGVDMSPRMSWAECAAVGMSKAEACKHRGTSPSAALYQQKVHGIQFANGYKTPEHAARARAASRKHIEHLTDAQKVEYRVFIKNDYRPAEALAAIGATL